MKKAFKFALNWIITLKSVDIPYATHYSGQPIRIIVKMQRPLKNAAKCCQNVARV